MWWPIGVCAVEDGDEVSFECLDCSLCKVSSVHVCVDWLVVKVLRFDAGNQVIGDFIVQAMEDWFDSSTEESFVACIIALDQMVCSSAFDRFSKDGI